MSTLFLACLLCGGTIAGYMILMNGVGRNFELLICGVSCITVLDGLVWG